VRNETGCSRAEKSARPLQNVKKSHETNSTVTMQGLVSPLPAPPATASPETVRPRRLSDAFLYAVLAALVVAAWQFSRLEYFTSGDDIGYWIGVAGATMMLLLFSYPLRKYLRFTHRWGKVKWWFVAHMTLGIGGPLLILVHSTFRLRSINATVALVSMLIVAISGVAGRFLYLRIHRDLQGKRSDLAELQQRAGFAEGQIRSRFRFAPKAAERLLKFEVDALAGGRGWGSTLRRVLILPLRKQWVYRACVRDLSEQLRLIAREQNWSRVQALRRRRQALQLTREYLRCVVHVAQFTAYERLFALWHVLHVPFVYLLVITACFHIFAVHAY
jgi:hypothetical protein